MVQLMLTYTLPVFVLFVSSTSGVFFDPSGAGVITDCSQSVKDIHSYFKTQPDRKTSTTESRYSFYRMD